LGFAAARSDMLQAPRRCDLAKRSEYEPTLGTLLPFGENSSLLSFCSESAYPPPPTRLAATMLSPHKQAISPSFPRLPACLRCSKVLMRNQLKRARRRQSGRCDNTWSCSEGFHFTPNHHGPARSWLFGQPISVAHVIPLINRFHFCNHL
jgi:hypothetical protein